MHTCVSKLVSRCYGVGRWLDLSNVRVTLRRHSGGRNQLLNSVLDQEQLACPDNQAKSDASAL